MEQIKLLMLAIQLYTAVLSHPEMDKDFRESALRLADLAIYSASHIEVNTPVQNTPVLGTQETIVETPQEDVYSIEILKPPAEDDPEIRFMILKNGNRIYHPQAPNILLMYNKVVLYSGKDIVGTALDSPDDPGRFSPKMDYYSVRLGRVLEYIGRPLRMEVLITNHIITKIING